MLLTPWRKRFRRWRRSRPFWGGLAAALAGAEICALPLAPLKVMLTQGVAGIPSVLMGLVMIVLGVSVWFAPHYRTLAGVVTTLIATAALVLSNLGGFLFGTLLGIVGGGLMFAWQPRTPTPGASTRSGGTATSVPPAAPQASPTTARHAPPSAAPLSDPQGAQP
ncbi:MULTISPECIES: DUF6114 domain-containing protein [Streptomyces]|uniref:DUF6114 domain-containing protein n=1 Tax=Streptomyces TaxID=1883 RepID=UPI0019B674FA|nr:MULTISPECIES: DUF6114 domain-containing protein [Streptomyces]GGT85750.1 hypothetical protein GCM10010272_33170 [Streptomyces lateritius]